MRSLVTQRIRAGPGAARYEHDLRRVDKGDFEPDFLCDNLTRRWSPQMGGA